MTNKATDIQKALTDPLEREECVKSPAPSTAPKPAIDKKSFEARYAALRNHRIRLEDAIDPNAERVSEIHKNDILFGRGKGFQNHPGNRRMREIVEKYKIRYHTLRRSEKQELIEAVYAELTEVGARFLKRLEKEDVWVNVDRPVALQKVSHTLRCRKGVLDKVMVNENLPSVNKVVPGGMSQQPTALMPTSLAGLHTSFHPSLRTSSPSLEVQGLPPANSALSGLEAQRLAALERFRALTTMPFVNSPAAAQVAPTATTTLLDHYSNLRREQFMIRELMVQQMQQEQMLSGRMGLMNHHLGALGAPSMVSSAMLPTGAINTITN